MVNYVWNGTINPFTVPFPLKAYRGSSVGTQIRINAGHFDCTGSFLGDILLDESRIQNVIRINCIGAPTQSNLGNFKSGPCIVDSSGNGIVLYRNMGGGGGNDFHIKRVTGYVLQTSAAGRLATGIPNTIYTNALKKIGLQVDVPNTTVTVYSGNNTTPSNTYTFTQLGLTNFNAQTKLRGGILIKGQSSSVTQIRTFEVIAELNRKLQILSAEEILIGQLLALNPIVDRNKISIGSTLQISGNKNSASTIMAVPNSGYRGSQIVNHNRVNLSILSNYGTPNFLMTAADTFNTLLTKINAKYGILLNNTDIVEQTLPVISPTTKEADFTLSTRANSRGYVGSLATKLILT